MPSISATSSAQAAAALAPVVAAKTQSAPQASPAKKEDSVQLSPRAQAAASRDVDHDGDSH